MVTAEPGVESVDQRAETSACRPVSRLVLLVMLLIVAGVVSFWGATVYNDFPLGWHPDEPSKVAQLKDAGQRNYNHPQLLLETTLLYMRCAGTDRSSDQAVAEAGRTTTAIFTSLTVICLIVAAYAYGGMPCALLAFPAVVFCPFLLLFGRFLKEDPALLFGLSLFVLAVTIAWRVSNRPGLRRFVWLGVGVSCGFVISSKYVGCIILVPALVAACFLGSVAVRAIPWRVMLLLAGVVLTTGAINYRIFDWNWITGMNGSASVGEPAEGGLFCREFRAGLERELRHVTTAHKNIAVLTPNTFAIQAAIRETLPFTLPMALSLPVVLWVERRRFGRLDARLALDVVLAVTLVSWAILLSFSVIVAVRYGLPLILLLHFGAATASWRWLCLLKPCRMITRAAAVCIATSLLAAPNLLVAREYYGQLRDDSRDLVREWLAMNAPRGAVVAADMTAGLTHAGPGRPSLAMVRPDIHLRVIPPGSSPVDPLAKPYDFLVVTDSFLERFLRKGNMPVAGAEEYFEARRRFCRELKKRRTPLWQHRAARPTGSRASPDIFVYKPESWSK